MREMLLVLVLLLGAVQGACAFELVDDHGVRVTFTRTPQRIVSLLPSLTESICELGQCGRLVGVDRYSNYPPQVKKLPQLGGGIDPNVEAVVALKPDVVVLATSSRAGERLRSLGLAVVALEPHTGKDLQRILDRLGTLLQVDGAPRVWRQIQDGVAAAAAGLPPRVRNTRVYFEVNRAPYAAGTSSFVGEMLSQLGVQNIIPPELGPFPHLNPEFVVRANPDVIMIGDHNQTGMEQRPGWSGIRAVRENRICAFAPQVSEMLVRAGPRMPEAARVIARCLAEKAP